MAFESGFLNWRDGEWVKALDAKPEDPNWILGTHMVKREKQLLLIVLGIHTHTHIHQKYSIFLKSGCMLREHPCW